MAYEDYRTKTTSRKIVLAEFDIGKEYSKWVNEGPGIWKTRLYFNEYQTYGYKSDGFCFAPYQNSGSNTITNEDFTKKANVGDVQEDGTSLTEKSTYSLMYSNAGSWYFDETNQLLYVHMTNSDWIYEHQMSIGLTNKLTNDSAANDLGQGYYEERLTGVSSIEKTKDSHIFGLIQHTGGTLEIDNHDGLYDDFINMDYYGQQVVLKHGFQGLGYADFLDLANVYVESAEFDYDKIIFHLRDDRQRLSRKIPINTFDQTTYSNLNDDDLGKSIPIFYGEIRGAPVICTNKDESGSPNWTFKVCDTSDHSNGINAITTVYVAGVETSAASTDLSAGTFTLSNGDWNGEDEVTFDGQGLKDSGDSYIQKGLDVIEDLLSTYLSISYSSANYDTTEWASAESDDLNNNVGIWIDEPIEIIEVIEKICTSIGGSFILKDDGTYTFRITDTQGSSDRTIELQEYLEPIRIKPDSDNLLTVVRIGYKKNLEEDKYRWYVDDSKRSDIYAKYSKDKDIELETYLIASGDAEELADQLYNIYDAAEPIVEIITHSQNMDLEIMDIITIPMQRVGTTQMVNDIVAEIIGLQKDPLNGQVNIIARKLRDA